MAVEEALYEFRRPMHHTRSHSFASLASPRPSGASAVMMAILPVLSISTRAICTPAAVTALTARVTSCCRNVEGARATGAPHKAGRRDWERRPQSQGRAGAPRCTGEVHRGGCPGGELHKTLTRGAGLLWPGEVEPGVHPIAVSGECLHQLVGLESADHADEHGGDLKLSSPTLIPLHVAVPRLEP